MEQNKNQMPLGTWEKLDTTEREKSQKVDFPINKEVKIVFMVEEPQEHTGDNGGVYYIFDVEEDKQRKVIMTSAWSLLRGIKLLKQKNGKLLGVPAKITKQMIKGKQSFLVEAI